jgi:hypothetical protein
VTADTGTYFFGTTILGTSSQDAQAASQASQDLASARVDAASRNVSIGLTFPMIPANGELGAMTLVPGLALHSL